MMKSRFQLLFCVLWLPLAVLFAGCSERSTVREVVVYTSVDQVYSEPILKAYEAQTGVKVKAVFDVEAAKTTGLVTRLEAEMARPQADVFWNNEFAQTISLAGKGVLEAYQSPSSSSIQEGFKDGKGYWAGMGGRARVFIVNTNLVKPADYPSSIDDLLDSRRPAASIGIANPLFGTTATHAAALYATRGAGSAREFYQALRAREIRLVDGNSVVRDLVANGQLAFGLTDTDDAAEAIARGAPVKVVVPDQDKGGTLVIPGSVGLIAGAPHPAEAKALIDYLLSSETENALIRSGGCQASVRAGGSPVGDPAFAGIKVMPVSLADVQSMLPRALAELREIFVK